MFPSLALLGACVHACMCALSGLSLSAIGSDTEGDAEDMFSDAENKPSTNSEPRWAGLCSSCQLSLSASPHMLHKSIPSISRRVTVTNVPSLCACRRVGPAKAAGITPSILSDTPPLKSEESNQQDPVSSKDGMKTWPHLEIHYSYLSYSGI